ncbi:hypothetical protein IBT50_25320 [Bacillus sp. S70]|uniref:hypothetical protein n=1 Tax=unclassified Bacillus (in: firmicutes) TaxID=185979 RepID=UPI00190BFFAC|nr:MULTISPECIES: hypothetical protein [unclassified Bacillus (in: firmicutes)]MBJ9983571.1 hypothetical protein [Bacillus sp. S29]MBK0104683.1 hypothetical protein [Bacillus sp. S70]MBK0110029.1 hypothetical protein [Bacillus sp. S73]MBK0138810.1 hypothetical protein [Bacillus sp. S72]MBK0148000.1 hypothetical protein [Bacillus sp. S74]
MLYFLLYIAIGMVFVSTGAYGPLRKLVKESDGKTEEERAMVAIQFLLTLLFVAIICPFWPVLLTFKIIGFFKKEKKEVKVDA